MRIHLIGVCGTAMATLAALLKHRGHDVSGSDEHVYPPMSDFLRAEGITAARGLSGRSTSPGRSIWSWSATPSRAATPSSRRCSIGACATARCRRPIRDLLLWGAQSIVIAGTHGKTTTTSLAGWLLTHAGVDPDGARRRHRAELRHRRRQLPAGQRAGVRHRRRRIRQRLLRQDREVPEVPADHRGRQQHRVRSRRHLRRPRRRPAGVPAARQPRAADGPDAARHRQPGCRGAGAARRAAASRRSASPRAPTGARSTSPSRRARPMRRPRSAGPAPLPRAPRRRGSRASSSCRWLGEHNVRNALAAIAVGAELGVPLDTLRQGLARVQGREAPARGRRRAARRDGLRRLRPSSDRGGRNAARRPRRRLPAGASGPSSSRARPRRAGGSSRRTSRARLRRRTRW